MKLLIYLLLTATLALPAVIAYDEGAPEEACESMDPSLGHEVLPQTKPPPYETVPLQVKIEKGGQVEIVLRAINGTFKGFMTMAFDVAYPDTPIGTFEGFDDKLVKTLNCSGVDNAITQTTDSYKVNVTAIWRAPELFFGTVVFKTTFIQKKIYYWVAVPSVANVTVPYCNSASGFSLDFALWVAVVILPILGYKTS